MKKISLKYRFQSILLIITMAFSITIAFGTYSAEGKNVDLTLEDTFDDNRIDSSLWRTVFGSWKEESKLIHSRDYFLPNEKYLYLRKNISGYKHYEISIDIKKAPLEYKNEYTDGGIIIGNNLINNYEIYLDTSNKRFTMYKKNWFFNDHLVFNEKIDELTQSGTYNIEMVVDKDKNAYGGIINLKDSSNNLLFSKELTDIPLHFNKIYLYSKWWKWSAFDNFNLFASKEPGDINAPGNFSTIQNGENIELSWEKVENTSYLELVYSNEEITEDTDVTVIDSNINKNNINYTLPISTIEGLEYGNDYYFGIRAVHEKNKNKITYSDYAIDNVYILSKPESPIYSEYDSKIEISWNPSPGAYKYYIRSENNDIGETIENKYIIDKPLSNNINLSKLNIVAFRDESYSQPSNYATKLDVQKIEDLVVLQNGNSYILNWTALSDAIGYEIYSSKDIDNLVKVGEVYSNSFTFDILRDGQLIDEYGNERYFAVKPIFENTGLAELSNIVSVVFMPSIDNILEGNFGVVDRANPDNILMGKNPINIYFGETVSMKSSFTINNGSLYNSIIKFNFKNNELFKFTLPEPVIRYKEANSNIIKQLDYKADFSFDDEDLNLIIRPIVENNVLNPGNIEISIMSDIVPKNVNELKEYIQDENYYMRKLPYEIESKIPDTVNRTIETKMQILFNTDNKEVINDTRDYESSERILKLELKDIPEIPNAF